MTEIAVEEKMGKDDDANRTIEDALGAKTIAVVGLSKDPSKPSQDVGIYLKSNGYRIVRYAKSQTSSQKEARTMPQTQF